MGKLGAALLQMILVAIQPLKPGSSNLMHGCAMQMLEDQRRLAEQLQQMQQKFMSHMEASAAQLESLRAQLSQQAPSTGTSATDLSRTAGAPSDRAVTNGQPSKLPPVVSALMLVPMPAPPAAQDSSVVVVEEPQGDMLKQADQQTAGSLPESAQQLLLEAGPGDAKQQTAASEGSADMPQVGNEGKPEETKKPKSEAETDSRLDTQNAPGGADQAIEAQTAQQDQSKVTDDTIAPQGQEADNASTDAASLPASQQGSTLEGISSEVDSSTMSNIAIPAES